MAAWSPDNKVWKDNKKELKVYFYKAEPDDKWRYKQILITAATVMDWAKKWNHLPMADQEQAKFIPRFDLCYDKQYADIRVEFSSKSPTWSLLGSDAERETDKNKPTMVLNLDCDDFLKKHRVVHEFGHALGLGHEHQNPDYWKHIKDCLNLPEMRKSLGIGIDDFEKQWEGKADSSSIKTKYDKDSVMHYWSKTSWLLVQYQDIKDVHRMSEGPKKEALLGFHSRVNSVTNKLSEMDQKFVAKLYYESDKQHNPEKYTELNTKGPTDQSDTIKYDLDISTLILLKWTDDKCEEKKLKIISRSSSEWEQMGNLLNLKNVSSFYDEYRRNDDRCCTHILEEWLKRGQNTRKYPTTWKGLCTLFRDVDLGQLAEELEDLQKLYPTRFAIPKH